MQKMEIFGEFGQDYVEIFEQIGNTETLQGSKTRKGNRYKIDNYKIDNYKIDNYKVDNYKIDKAQN